jgi:hypothetical protein
LLRLECASYPAPFKENVTIKIEIRNKKPTVNHISIESLVPVNAVGDYNNESDKDPDDENHKFRDIFWHAPAEDKHTECVYRNSLFISDKKNKDKKLIAT